MSITVRKVNERLRSIRQLKHLPSGFGQGKWENRRSLWGYKRLARRRRQIAAASRRANRSAA